MSSVPMPKDLSEEAVAEWLDASLECNDVRRSDLAATARAVRALVSAKVREAVDMTRGSPFSSDDAIIARVMREEAPRG